jgi:hypothetical protein
MNSTTFNSYCLFLDDERLPKDVHWLRLPENVEWVIARNYGEFVSIVEKRGLPKFVAFDNDLCDKHYEEFFAALEGKRPFNYNICNIKTGYHCAEFLFAYCLRKACKLPDFVVHSRNTFAQKDIKRMLDQFPNLIYDN